MKWILQEKSMLTVARIQGEETSWTDLWPAPKQVFFTTRNFLRKDLLHEMFGILKMGKFNFVQFVANV